MTQFSQTMTSEDILLRKTALCTDTNGEIISCGFFSFLEGSPPASSEKSGFSPSASSEKSGFLCHKAELVQILISTSDSI